MNLLRVFSILLEERNVTSAATRLHLSQSAVSKQLAKLRLSFSDPLFERESKGLYPTPKALALAPKIQEILLQIDQLTLPDDFEPEQSRRVFHIDLIETAYVVTYPRFMPTAMHKAPNITVNSRTWNDESFKRLMKRDIDFGIGIFEWDERSHSHVSNIPKELNYIELMRDYPICLMRPDHPALKKEWNIETFLAYRHIQVTDGGINKWLLQEILESEYQPVNYAVNMSDLRSALSLCVQSDLLLCYPISSVKEFIKDNTLIMKTIPLTIAPGGHFLLWHKHFDDDPAHKWLRTLIIDLASSGIEESSDTPTS